jgi:hypothetical protein
MPLLYIHKSSGKPNDVLLLFKETGKASASDWPQIEAHLRSEYGVITFDFRGLGETRMRTRPFRPTTLCWESWTPTTLT